MVPRRLGLSSRGSERGWSPPERPASAPPSHGAHLTRDEPQDLSCAKDTVTKMDIDTDVEYLSDSDSNEARQLPRKHHRYVVYCYNVLYVVIYVMLKMIWDAPEFGFLCAIDYDYHRYQMYLKNQ